MSAQIIQSRVDPRADQLQLLTDGESFIINQDDGTLINATWNAASMKWMLHKLDFNKGTCESAELDFCRCHEIAGMLRVMKLEWK